METQEVIDNIIEQASIRVCQLLMDNVDKNRLLYIWHYIIKYWAKILLQLPADVDKTNLEVLSKPIAKRINRQVRIFHEKLITVRYNHSQLSKFREKIKHKRLKQA